MNPTFTIARLEWRRAWLGRKVLLASLCLTTLTTLASIEGVRKTSEVRREKQEATEAMRRFWLGQGQENPHSAAHFGTYVFQPTPPLAFFEPGLLPVLPTSTRLEAHRQNLVHFRPTRDEAPGRFLPMSPAGLLQTLLPLLALLVAFDSVTGERERGTLAQLLGSGVSGRQILLGKLLGALRVLGVASLPAVMIPMIVGMFGSVAGLRDTLVLAWMIGLYAIGLATWVALAVFVSAKCRSSRQALVALLGIWVAQIALVPRIANATTELLSPLPTLGAFEKHVEDDLKAGIDGHSEDERTKVLEREVLAQYGVKKVEDLPINFDGLRMQASEEHGNLVFDRHFGALFDTIERRERYALWFGLVSPGELLRPASMALASTDFAYHRSFVMTAEQFRRDLVKKMNQAMTERSKTGDWEFKVGEEVWREVPPFEAPAPRARPIRTAQIGLLTWLVAACLALLFAGRRVVPS